jgi:uncharacterized protein YndB with AHSA1/START domain
MSQTAQVDTIERSIMVSAPIEKVWKYVAKTGWWAGPAVRFDYDGKEGETVQRDAEQYGTFPVRVEKLDPPRYAAFRWASAYPGAALTATNSTLIEFSLKSTDSGVQLDVKESGFASLEGDHPFIAEQFAGNTEGWKMQFEALVNAIESDPS